MKSLVAVITVSLFIIGCAHTPPIDDKEQSRVENSIRRIVESPLSAGTIYVAGARNRFDPLLDFVSLRVVSPQVGGFESNLQVRNPSSLDLGSFLLGEPEGLCDPAREASKFVPRFICNNKSPVTLSIRPLKVVRTQVTDSLTLLEVLNRPLTGLNYNQTAEGRITQWRTALASANDNAKIFLCSSLTTMLEGQLIVRGKLSRDAAKSIARTLNRDSVMTMDFDRMTADVANGVAEYAIPIVESIQIEAVLTRLTYEESDAYPKLILSIGGNKVLTLQK